FRSFIIIASVSPLALMLGAGISILSAIIGNVVAKPLQRHEKERSQLFDGYTSYIKEVLGAFQIVKDNNLNEKVKKDFYKNSKDIQEKRYIMDKIHTYILEAQSFIINSTTFYMLAVTVLLAIKGRITTGAVILIVDNLSQEIYPLMELGEWLPQIIAVKAIYEQKDTRHENK